MSNIAIVERFIDAWAARDVDRIMGFFTTDAVYHNIPMDAVSGTQAIRQTIEGFVGMGSEIVFETHHIAEGINGVVMTERTDKFRINGKWLDLPVMGIFELADGKITHWRDYFDIGQFQTQMAAINAA